MNFNHIITKEEKDTLWENNKKAWKVYKTAHYLFLVLSTAIMVAAVFMSFASMLMKEKVLAAVCIFAAVLYVFLFRKSIRTYRGKKGITYINKLDRAFPLATHYNVVADEEKIVVNDKLVLYWRDISVAFIYREYVILASKRKMSVVTKPATEEEKAQICDIVNKNNGSVLPVDGLPEHQKYHEDTLKRAKRKMLPFRIAAAIAAAICLVYIIIPDKDDKKPAYDPTVAYHVQMTNALTVNEYTGFDFDAEYMFDIYTEYVKQNFNTTVRTFGDTPNDRELWFFDGDKANFGVTLIQSNGINKGQIFYYTDKNALEIAESADSAPQTSQKRIKLESWDDIFDDLIKYDYTMEYYPQLESFGGSSEVYFYVNFKNEAGNIVSYGFGENYIQYKETEGEKTKDSFLMVFKYTDEEKIANTKDVFSYAAEQHSITQSVQQIFFDQMTEEVEKYCDYDIIE